MKMNTSDDNIATISDRMSKSATFHDFCDDHEIDEVMQRCDPTTIINGSTNVVVPTARRRDRLQSFGNWVQLFWLKRRLMPSGGGAASIHDRRVASSIIRPSVSLCMYHIRLSLSSIRRRSVAETHVLIGSFVENSEK